MPQAPSAPAGLPARLARLLPGVVRPARYTGNEWNSIVKDWSGRLRVCLLWPDVYEEGVCDPWLQGLYAELNRHDDMLCERAFLPWPDMDEAMGAASLPLYALESRRPLSDFDLVLCLLPDELGAPGMLTGLSLAGLGWSPAGKPFVAAAGAGAANAPPLAGFVHAVLLGDVDAVALRQTVDALRSKHARPDWLCTAADAPSRVTAARCAEALPLPARPIVPFVEARRERVTVDLARRPGYPWSDEPWHERSLDDILAGVTAMLGATGYDHVHLSGPHGELAEIVDRLSARYRDARLQITLDTPVVTRETIDLADRLPHFTRGPLAIDLAHVAGDELCETARLAYRRGWHIIRLLASIGAPGQTVGDVEAFAAAARRVRDIGREEIDGRAQVQVIATPFTPRRFGRHAGARLIVGEEWQERVAALAQGVRGPGLRVQWRGLETRLVTAALARGDRRMGAVIEQAWRAGMRRPADALDAAAWEAAARAAGVDLAAQAAGG